MSGTRASILIVDDQPDNLRTLAAILSTEGYKVRKAVSGEMAVQTACSQPPDLILLDIKMPQMDGYSVCSNLKAQEATREIPVIFLSALGDTADKVKAFALGGADYITKPFQAEEVVARVKHQLRLQKLSKQLIEKNTRLQQEIEERKQAEEEMKASLREKEVLLAEIHHRVKNNLHLVSTLLYLQATRSQNRQVREILQDSRNRISSMALIHESLYQSAHNFAEVNLADYIKKLSTNLLNIYQSPPNTIVFNISEETNCLIQLSQAIPCGLIVNELVTNALKYGLQDPSESLVSVTLECSDTGQLLIAVANTGDKLPADFNLQNQQSMGLKLVTTLVKQLNGIIELERGNQTIFTIKFMRLGMQPLHQLQP